MSTQTHKRWRPDFVLLSVVGAIALFALFIVKLQFYVVPRLPQSSYSIGIQTLSPQTIQITSYQIDSVAMNRKLDSVNNNANRKLMLLKAKIDSLSSNRSSHAVEDKIKSDLISTEKELAQMENEIRTNALLPGKTNTYGLKVLAFNANPKLLLWIITFALMVAVSFIFLMSMAEQIIRIKSRYTVKLIQWSINVLVALFFFILLIVTNLIDYGEKLYLPPFDIIKHLGALFYNEVFYWINAGEVFAFFVGSMALMAILLLNSHLKNLQRLPLSKERFVEFKGDLDRALTTFSVLIVFSVMTISFLNQALIIHYINIEKLNVIRSEFIYVYGFIFSSLLALIYIPISQKLSSLTTPELLKDDAEKPKKTFYGDFQSLLAILGPLLGSSAAQLIKSME